MQLVVFPAETDCFLLDADADADADEMTLNLRSVERQNPQAASFESICQRRWPTCPRTLAQADGFA